MIDAFFKSTALRGLAALGILGILLAFWIVSCWGAPGDWQSLIGTTFPRVGVPQWFPDGNRIVFDYMGGIWIADLENGGLELVDGGLETTRTTVGVPSISHDGLKIAYAEYSLGGGVRGIQTATGRSWLPTPTILSSAGL